ncbi:tryptophan--tRNA ligase [Xylophilus sp.]|uniref:tryptophan--tRNA ligase n=1 Tax=Xylophilus sp. TaxID=2653893 RepID=UPI0013B7886C|nr:tryptophan--tRNA ligase [Xylophilus sp.]KAF1043629.1 MAG: Tryptophan--tRNA ligase [Xylophilus sp.]
MSTTRFLSGIKPTGAPHLGNYVGMIRPAVAASRQPGVESFYFLADYHALIGSDDPERIHRSTLEIAATWLAVGLDPDHVVFYRQSDIPEIPKLNWLLSCVTGKGLLNRAHAYKAAQDRNAAAGRDADDGVSVGLYMYPVLMAADILLFKADKVPVGRDQIQHVEIARDIAASFNHLYGEHFVPPEAVIDEQVATLAGLDGRKMSKSYDNTIPLFSSRDQLQKLIAGIQTDSRAPGEPKETEGSALFQIFQAFATPGQAADLRRRYAEGIAWGEAKALLLDQVDGALAPARARYEALIAEPGRIEDVLLDGAERARAIATPFIQELRAAVGLRSLRTQALAPPKAAPAKAQQPAVFKQYRGSDGRFYFKLVGAQGRLLLQSRGFAAPRDAGQAIARLQRKGEAALAALAGQIDTAATADVAPQDLAAALQSLGA